MGWSNKTFNYLKHSYKDDEDKFLSATSHEVSNGMNTNCSLEDSD